MDKEQATKILFVDDEPQIREWVSEELEDIGYHVTAIATGENIWELIQEVKPDVIILDINLGPYEPYSPSENDILPVEAHGPMWPNQNDGLELAARIRYKFYNLPIIVLTAYDTFKEDLRSLALDYYVIKSFDLGEFKEKVQMAIECHLSIVQKG